MESKKMKLIACILYEEGKTINPELAIKSVKDYVDKIIVIDGTKYPKEKSFMSSDGRILILNNSYDHNIKGGNGKQRNVYLDYLKKNNLGDWAIVLDADECISNPENIKKVIEEAERNNIDCVHVRMHHYIGNFGFEDATLERHYVTHRVFKIKDNLIYPESEHPILQGVTQIAVTDEFKYHHLGYCEDMFKLRHKFLTHSEKSEMHTPKFLTEWYHAHALGEYPVKKVNPDDLPKEIKEYFLINEDYLYFRHRGVELKHAECVRQWNEYFEPTSVLDIGCGRGPYLRYWEQICNSSGYEISVFAIQNKLCDSKIHKIDITGMIVGAIYNLVTCLDVLEHLSYEDIDKALDNIYKCGNRFLFSIPYIGNPDLLADKTHIIKETKEWWIQKLTEHGFKVKDVPDYFYYHQQLLEATK